MLLLVFAQLAFEGASALLPDAAKELAKGLAKDAAKRFLTDPLLKSVEDALRPHGQELDRGAWVQVQLAALRHIQTAVAAQEQRSRDLAAGLGHALELLQREARRHELNATYHGREAADISATHLREQSALLVGRADIL